MLPLLGVIMTENQFVTVSEWMVKGNIRQFLEANPNADRLALVCFSSPSLVTYVDIIVAVGGRHQGVDLYA